MHSEKIAADVKLKGRELEAMEVALRQFRVAQFHQFGGAAYNGETLDLLASSHSGSNGGR
jgi:hypothetical protein